MAYRKPELSLERWLRRLEKQHPRSIELGLDRVNSVYERLHAGKPGRQVITVAGTNGKGSNVAYTSALASACGWRCGSYTSPHLIRFNERIVIDGEPVTDFELCRVFEEIQAALNDVSLTYFEHTTLAALVLFSRADLDLAILEVGLGGRLDAVNIIDPDVSVITSIGLDHQDWLGDDREQIGFEKAGIMRPATPVICGERDLPDSVRQRAAELAAPLSIIGIDYQHADARPVMAGDAQKGNLATAVAALEALPEPSALTAAHIATAAGVIVPGRFQKISEAPDVFIDVAHNLQAAQQLACCIKASACNGKRWLVLGILADKQVEAVARCLDSLADEWCFASLTGPRAQTGQQLEERLSGHLSAPSRSFESVGKAIEQVMAEAVEEDQVIIFGSFLTVTEAFQYWNR